MTDKLQQEAREAGDRYSKLHDYNSPRDYINGYLAAADARDKEIEELRERINELEAEAICYQTRNGHYNTQT